jgi:hypothetical protein
MSLNRWEVGTESFGLPSIKNVTNTLAYFAAASATLKKDF